MPKQLPPPVGEPDPDASAIIDKIHAYAAADRDPVATVSGLRHIFYEAEQAWDASIVAARSVGAFYRHITEATGVAMGTLQTRMRMYARRQREGR